MSEPTESISTQSLQQAGQQFPPSADAIKRAHINAATYDRMYARSVNEPEKFWLEQARELEWFKQPTEACKFTWDSAARKI
ncbi:MAG: acetyl-coenzyme synthetase, partial [Verrucomicrobiota bacterium]